MSHALTPDRARAAIHKVLKKIQELSGHVCPPLVDRMRPVEGELDEFDSLLGVEATIAVEAELGVSAGCDNLFISDDARALSIGEAVQRLVELAKPLEGR
jgi:hypothetical protein